MGIFDRLGQFMRRAGIAETGRDRLLQIRNRLQFILVTEEISDNSLREVLQTFSCPVYKSMKMSDIERYLGLRGTKVVGFHRSPLSTQIQRELKGCICKSVQRLPEHPRVAVLGGSSLARHHAEVWKEEGAESVALLDEGAERGDALAKEIPDIVDVCLQADKHFDAIKKALEAGSHVLCEAPLVFENGMDGYAIYSQACELWRLSERKGLMLGTSLRYTSALKKCLELWRSVRGDDKIERFSGEIRVSSEETADASRLWMEFAPHLIGCSQQLARDAELDCGSIECRFEEGRAEVDYACRRPDGSYMECLVCVTHEDGSSDSDVVLQINDDRFELTRYCDEQGGGQLEICGAAGRVVCQEPIRQVISSFLHGKVEVPPRQSCRNLDWLVKLMEWPVESGEQS